MNFDPQYFGAEGIVADDREYAGSRFSEVRKAIFANRYYLIWGTKDDPPLPVYAVTLGRALSRILPFGKPWRFEEAARRTVARNADLRWGPEGKGFRRIVHPNGICLTGTWEIRESREETAYTGYFRKGAK